MKPLLLNTYDLTGGAARAAYRLHRGLRSIGVESRLLVQHKRGDDPDVLGPESTLGRAMARVRPALDSLPVRRRGRSASDDPLRAPFARSPFTTAWVPDRLAARVRASRPDLVHLHWVAAGFMKLETLGRFGLPLVWTLHDSWAFTGGCHVPFQCVRYRQACGACPALGSTREDDLSRRIWRRKRGAWRDVRVTLVAPSRWLASCARSSALFGGTRCEVIPNGLDLERFKPADRAAARARFSLPRDKTLLLFGGVSSLTDPNKGLHLLAEALHRIPAPVQAGVELVVFGAEPHHSLPPLAVRAHSVGQLANEEDVAALYAAADVFVAPSLQENLPNTVMEAMACGTPCVAFDAGGLPDLIEHRRTGYLAKAYEPEDLARGIAWALQERSCGPDLAERSRGKATAEFEIGAIARRYAALYEEVLAEGIAGG